MPVTLVTGDDGSNVRAGGPGDDLIYGFNPAGPQGNVTSIAATRVAVVPGGAVFAVSPPGDTGRLFIGNLDGTVRILDLATGQLLPDVFIDIGSSIGVIGEGGLIGFAFDPNYASNGYFYVNVTNPSDDTEIRRYQVSATDPNHADPTSQTLLLRIDQPDGLTNHKGGWVEFGPDGYLYTALGDGGGGGDPTETGQNVDDLLGNILRLDVHGDDFPADPNRNYAVPDDNPFVGTTGADEIWAFGLRNPFRNGFDRGLGDLYIGDVGQNSFEEIDFGQRGANYGWDVFEGFMPFEAGPLTGGSAVDPIFAYGRSVGATVIGGYVYRGQSEGLQGEYFFADAGNGKIFTLHNNGGSWSATERTAQITPDIGSITSPVSFGQDVLGNLYVVDLDGEIFRLTPIAVSADLGDVLDGGGGNDMLFGGSGNDTMHGGSGNDSLYGGQGDDILTGEGDADFMFGDAGNDTYFVEQSGDVVFERPNDGTDTVVASISFTLGANVENLTLAEGAGSINATGNAADNVITGNSGDNTFTGGPGNDTINALAGSDFVSGGAGDDTMDGGAGIDTALFNVNSGTVQFTRQGDKLIVVSAEGTDTLTNFERLQFLDKVIGANFAADDFNRDGTSDVLLRSSSGLVTEWLMNAGNIGSNPGVGTLSASWSFQDTGDFDADGGADILWRHDNGQVVLWSMNGSQIESNQPLATIANSWHSEGAADFDGDGKSDVLWHHDSGQVALWKMDGAQIADNKLVATVSSAWHVSGLSDFGGDGKNDVLWRHDSGQVVIWTMNGSQIAANQSVANVGLDWNVAGTGDFNGDGKDDILWRHDSGQVALWEMDGANIVSNQSVATPSNAWHIQDVGDYDADGRSDVLWRHDSGQVAIWEMDGATITDNHAVATPSSDLTILNHRYDLL